MLRCLEKDPELRFQDARSLQQALEGCQAYGQWNRQLAEEWWLVCGCPRKKMLDLEVFGEDPVCAMA
ncbi:MAG: hypothetical protein R3B90_08420 [Planctomycetaceae bacterium]